MHLFKNNLIFCLLQQAMADAEVGLKDAFASEELQGIVSSN